MTARPAYAPRPARAPARADRRGERGMTLLELIVSLAIFAVVAGLLGVAFQRSAEDVGSGLQSADLDHTLRRVVFQAAREVADSGEDGGIAYLTSHPPDQSTNLTSITFRRRIATEGEPTTDWGTPITFALVASPGEDPTDGVDNDGDGIVNERRITRTQDGNTTVVADSVTQATFARAAGEDTVSLSVRMARRDTRDGKVYERTLGTRVALRNRELD